MTTGELMYSWAKDLFPINRSITGVGVRETLDYIGSELPQLERKSIASGSKVFDWTIPDEWAISDGYIENEEGEKIIDFKRSNLHVVGYSTSVDAWLTRDEILQHIYSLPEKPDAIPYITSYYKRTWGFCMADRMRRSLPEGRYHAFIDSQHFLGQLDYGEILIKGKSDREIFISTYICHPSMANNEVSGPVVTMALVKWLSGQKELRYSYRIVFLPETIGSIAYISRNLENMKSNIVCGFNVTCVGDNRTYSFMGTRKRATYADKVGLYAMRNYVKRFEEYSFLDRGSDERQYCSPLVDLPVVSIMRSKYNTYPEYHTSLDDLTMISPAGLDGAFSIIKRCIEIIELNRCFKAVLPCEPFLSSKGLYPTLSTTDTKAKIALVTNILAYADGTMDLIDMSDVFGVDFFACADVAFDLSKAGLLSETDLW